MKEIKEIEKNYIQRKAEKAIEKKQGIREEEENISKILLAIDVFF